MLPGKMMDEPLLITSFLRYAEKIYPDVEIVSVTQDSPRHRTSYGECFERARRLANALTRLGVTPGDRIGTMAWNDHRHFEAYYAIPCMGAVCHTINPRLFAEQLLHIVNHAEDEWILTDPLFLPLFEKMHSQFTGVKGYIVLTDEEHMPETALDNVHCYETLLSNERADFRWPDLDERSASSLCYTSGTTGNPKGVLYSHRSNFLHTMTSLQPNIFNLGVADCVLPVVPMFHANAWGVPYAAPVVGAKLILPGPKLADGATLYDLMDKENVTLALGVPTVWLALLEYLDQNNLTLDKLKRTIVGGAACPTSIMDAFRDKHDVFVHHAWGMTETSPLGTFTPDLHICPDVATEEIDVLRAKQGRPPFGIDIKIVDPEGKDLPWNGSDFGTLKVRGPFVCDGYFKLDESDAHDDDGWFDTGDVATIDPRGFMEITDRVKDVIKSGGEWISSLELEEIAMRCEGVGEAAAVGINHPKWTERPLLVVVKKEGAELDASTLKTWFDGKMASWWMPDDVVFVEELPHTATGKLNKLKIREMFKDHYAEES
ncbi:MAG: long-chain fatty acid--CoA ligase [Gammaproteobacteria bacterium]